MKRLNRKLSGSAGAAMVIALLFFLVCALVGTLTITAASANAGKIARSRQEQASYLAVRSAVGLMMDELSKYPFVGKYQVRENRVETLAVSGAAGEVTDVTIQNLFCISQPSLSGRFEATVGGATTVSGLSATYEEKFAALFYHNVRHQGAGLLTKLSALNVGNTVSLDGNPLLGADARYNLPTQVGIKDYIFRLTGLPDVKVSVSFSTAEDSLYGATITAASTDGNSKLIVTSPAKLITRAQSGAEIPIQISPKQLRREKKTDVVTTIAWQDWEVLQVGG